MEVKGCFKLGLEVVLGAVKSNKVTKQETANGRRQTDDSNLPRLCQQRISGLVRAVILNDLIALFLIALAILAFGTFLAALFFFPGWVIFGFLPVLVLLGFSWLRAARVKIVAYQVERFFPELQGRLVNALQLAEYKPGVEGYSLELRDAAIEQVEKLLAPLRLDRVLPKKRVMFSGLAALLAIGVFLGYLRFGGKRAELGLKNSFAANRVKIEFDVFPGDTALFSGENVVLGCRVKPVGVFKSLWLETKGKKIEKRRVGLINDSCSLSLVIKEGLKYRFRVLGKNSDWFGVGLLEPLTLRRLSFVCRPPGYTNLPEVKLTGSEIVALKGTVIDFSGEVNQPVEEGRLILGAESINVTVDLREPMCFSGRFVVKEGSEGKLELNSAQPGKRQTVARIRVRTLPDENPFLKVFLPGKDIDLPMNMQVLLGINTIDDYGLKDLWLHYGKESISFRVLLKHLNGRKEDTTFYVWDLSNSGLLPGEVISYYLQVTDNDAVSGPKSTNSEVFSIRFPTVAEIYSQTVEKTQITQKELEPIGAEQTKIGEEIVRLCEELKKTRQLSWEEKRRLEAVVNEQTKLLEKLDRLKEDVAKTQEEIISGMRFDQETMERLSQLQELLSRLLPIEMQKALKELGMKLSENPHDIRQALERLRLEQEKMKKSIEQALELLKRIMEEERLTALAREAQELSRAQEEMSRRLAADSQPTTADSPLAEKERAIQTGLDSLISEMAKLSKEISEPAFAESLAALNRELKETKVVESARELSAQLARGERKGAKEKSDYLQERLSHLSERLKSLAERLKRSRSQKVSKKLLTTGEQLITFSQAQEGLEEKWQKGAAPAIVAQEQMAIFEATRIVAETLGALGAQTLMVPPQLSQELARALNFMQEAAGALNEGRGYQAPGRMSQARQSLNNAIEMVFDAVDRAGQGAGLSGALENLLEALSQMTAEQMAINAGMSGLPIPIPASGLTAQEMQELLQLLAQQKSLREELENLLKSMGGDRPGLTGGLERLVEEMKGVERALSELQIDRKLIERQEGILSRLLDAQRSLRQEGFKEERRAETAKEYKVIAPKGLPVDKGERNRLLREELMRALKQGYPAEYERLIRNYFEKLLQE